MKRKIVCAVLGGLILAGCGGEPTGADSTSSSNVRSTDPLPSWIPPISEIQASSNSRLNRVKISDLVGLSVSEAKLRLGFPDKPPYGLSEIPETVAIPVGEDVRKPESELTVSAAVAVVGKRAIYLGVMPSSPPAVAELKKSRGIRQKNLDELITVKKLDGSQYVDAVYVQK